MENKLVSVICCYNKVNEYVNMCDSLCTQDIEHEIIGIDNTNNKFSSAASALNYGADKANGEILVFLHQDILFDKTNSLRTLVDKLQNYDNDCIVGIYGAIQKNDILQSGNYTKCDTLDECCIGMKKSTWQKLNFNEKLCDGWHLYVVELCLRAQKDEVDIVYINNCHIRHLSNGVVDESYMKTFKKLLIEYKNKKWITTTCKSMPTNLIYYYIYYFFWKIKKELFGNYPFVYRLKQIIRK